MFKKISLIGAMFMILGTTSPQAQDIAQKDRKVVLRVKSTGGRCTYGSCYAELLIMSDGMGLLKDSPYSEKPFTIDREELTELLTLIQKTDFKNLRKNKFTGTCPDAYDGTKNIYVFLASDGEEVLDSCETALDDESPLFKFIREIRRKLHGIQ